MTRSEPESLTLSLLIEVFFCNRSGRPIRIESHDLGSPFILRPRDWASRLVRRGSRLQITTRDLGRSAFEFWGDEHAAEPIDASELIIPLEAGNSLLLGWDGLAWRPLRGEAISDLGFAPSTLAPGGADLWGS